MTDTLYFLVNVRKRVWCVKKKYVPRNANGVNGQIGDSVLALAVLACSRDTGLTLLFHFGTLSIM